METLHKSSMKNFQGIVYVCILHGFLIGLFLDIFLDIKLNKQKNLHPKKKEELRHKNFLVKDCMDIYSRYYHESARKVVWKVPLKNIIKHKTCLIFHVHRQISSLSLDCLN